MNRFELFQDKGWLVQMTIKQCVLVCSNILLQSGMNWSGNSKIQNRVQKVGESLLEYSGDLRRMADKAYPSWPHTQRQELLRNQFIQGVRSPTVQLLLMKRSTQNAR